MCEKDRRTFKRKKIVSMNIEQLNEYQLTDLQSKISVRLKEIEEQKKDTESRKNSVKNKTKLIELTTKDRVLCISLSHGKLYDVDYVNVEGLEEYNAKEKPDWKDYYRISFGHKTKPLGCSSSVHQEELEKSYMLFEMCGSVNFLTMNPSTWEKDLEEVLKYSIKKRNYYHRKDMLKLKKNTTGCFKDKASKNRVNSFILESQSEN